MKAFVAVVMMIFVSSSILAKTPLQYSDVYEMIHEQKLRAAYFRDYDVSASHLDDLKDAGINSVMIKIYAGRPSSQEFFNSIKKWAEASRKRGMQMFVVINYVYFDYSDLPNGVNPSGHPYKFPAFTSEVYWSRIAECMKQIAEISKTYKAVTAILLDCEHYNTFESLSPESVSYQKDMVTKFMAHKRISLPEGKVNYYDFFKKRKLLKEYNDYYISKFHKTLAEIRKNIHEINPKIGLGYLPPCYIEDNWFQISLLKSWGAPKQPLMIFEERTYPGYQNLLPIEAKKVSEKFHALYIPGISLEYRFGNTPGRLASQLYDMAKVTPGYWIYSTYQLSPECLENIKTGKDNSAYGLTRGDSPEDFFKAIKLANLAIDLWEHDPGQAMKMTTAEKYPNYPDIDPKYLNVKKFKILKKGDDKKLKKFPPLREVKELLIVADKNETIQINVLQKIIAYHYSNEGGRYVLLSPKSKQVCSSKIPAGKTAEIRHVAEEPGVYRLIIDPGQNASVISTKNSAALTANMARLCEYNGIIYLEKVSSGDQAKIGIVADANGETVSFKLSDNTGKLLGEDAGEINTPVWIKLNNNLKFVLTLKPWQQGIYEDVRILAPNMNMLFSTVENMPLVEESR